MRRISAYLAVSAVAALAGSATAAPLFNFQLAVNGAAVYSSSTDPNVTVVPGPNGTYLVSGFFANAGTTFNYDLTLKDDPFATVNFNVTNTSGALGLYSTSLTMAVNPVLAAPTFAQGSVSGSLGDNSLNFDGAQITTIQGSAFYRSFINGVPFQDLYSHASALTEPFGGLTADLPAASFLNLPAGAVTTIGIANEFTLTADDSMGMISRFDVTPAPGAVSLFGMAGFIAARRRR